MSKHQDWENGSFEEFIRRSVEDPPLEFDPQAWETMEKKLDARTGGSTHADNSGIIGGGLLALLVMFLLGWYLLSGTEDNADRVMERQATEQLSNAEAGKETASGRQQSLPFVPGADEKKEQAPGEGDNSLSAGSPGAMEEVYLSTGENSADGKTNPAGSAFSEAESRETSGRAGNAAGSGRAAQRLNAPGALKVERVNTTGDSRDNMEVLTGADTAGKQALQRMPWQNFAFGDRKIYQLRQVMLDERVTERAQPDAAIVPPKDNSLPLSLSLSLAPDFSGMGKGLSARLGAGAGFHLEYRVLPRLGVVTGLVYSQKNYLANSSYSPYDFGYYYPKPDHIDASCGVLDIPINLRYYLLQGTRHSFFLSSGLSSYLMKREDYTMVFTDKRYDDYTYELRNENRHYFAVYNFSAGYEARISPRWAIQAEPFLKVPALGLGAGSIRLNSMGAFMHLKYQIGRLGN